MEIYNENYTVYIHKNKINDKVYIGVTKRNPEARWGSDGQRYFTQPFGEAIQQYGWQNFQHIIFASNLTKQQALNMQKILIEKLNARDPQYGYNIVRGGGCGVGMPGQKNPFYKKTPTKAIQASANKRRGSHLSQKQRKRISQTQKGRVKSDLQRQHISEFMKRVGRERVGAKSQRKKPVQCVQTGQIFPTQRMAAQSLGLTESAMKAALQRGTRCGGYHWMSINKESLTTIMQSQVARNGETLNESVIQSDLHGNMQLQ